MHFDGRFLAQLFAPAELDAILVFFPDPWTKVKKAKHRLLQPETLASWLTLLKPNGFFCLRTDQKVYFDWVAEALEKLGMKMSPLDSFLGPHQVGSCFGDRFKRQNVEFYEGKFSKR